MKLPIPKPMIIACLTPFKHIPISPNDLSKYSQMTCNYLLTHSPNDPSYVKIFKTPHCPKHDSFASAIKFQSQLIPYDFLGLLKSSKSGLVTCLLKSHFSQFALIFKTLNNFAKHLCGLETDELFGLSKFIKAYLNDHQGLL